MQFESGETNMGDLQIREIIQHFNMAEANISDLNISMNRSCVPISSSSLYIMQ